MFLLYLMYGIRQKTQLQLFTCRHPVFTTAFMEETKFSPLCVLGVLCVLFVYGLSVQFLWDVYVFYAMFVLLQILRIVGNRKRNVSNFVPFDQVYMRHQTSLWIPPWEFQDLLIYEKDDYVNFDGDCPNLKNVLCNGII